MANTLAVPFCVYCEADSVPLTTSELVKDGLRYPGVQMMCEDSDACQYRIHINLHEMGDVPECLWCAATYLYTITCCTDLPIYLGADSYCICGCRFTANQDARGSSVSATQSCEDFTCFERR